jgi:hypothetical protein
MISFGLSFDRPPQAQTVFLYLSASRNILGGGAAMTSEEIVQALRQCAKRDCSSCGMCPIFQDRECVEHLAAAAASLIERLTAENAALRKEIEWKDMVIALAQRKTGLTPKEVTALSWFDRLFCSPCKDGRRRQRCG